VGRGSRPMILRRNGGRLLRTMSCAPGGPGAGGPATPGLYVRPLSSSPPWSRDPLAFRAGFAEWYAAFALVSAPLGVVSAATKQPRSPPGPAPSPRFMAGNGPVGRVGQQAGGGGVNERGRTSRPFGDRARSSSACFRGPRPVEHCGADCCRWSWRRWRTRGLPGRRNVVQGRGFHGVRPC